MQTLKLQEINFKNIIDKTENLTIPSDVYGDDNIQIISDVSIYNKSVVINAQCKFGWMFRLFDYIYVVHHETYETYRIENAIPSQGPLAVYPHFIYVVMLVTFKDNIFVNVIQGYENLNLISLIKSPNFINILNRLMKENLFMTGIYHNGELIYLDFEIDGELIEFNS